VPSTDELYCLNMQTSVCSVLVELRLVKKTTGCTMNKASLQRGKTAKEGIII